MLGVLVSAAILTIGAQGGTLGLAALTLGTLLLDTAMQSGMVANQVRVYALRTDALSRLNTAYMTCAYLGGSAGSWLGIHVWSQAGWWGVCVLVALLAALALARHLLALYKFEESPARTHVAHAVGRGHHPDAGESDQASHGASVTRPRRRLTRRGHGGHTTGAAQAPRAG
ncbi:hypothetical protein GA0115256_14574 [Streptomyces sp. DconLS]|uniref:hypothetical protein n=1 Tax=Streptomyces TaxID=1883 RepID=UPI00081EC9B8|nr:hypothetical protein GA0115258_10143 [Streptomyces sp. LamerLS-31b]SCG02535.1 hypothetical protein GA0115256_14574 [Streptomyces sp. DconLS]